MSLYSLSNTLFNIDEPVLVCPSKTILAAHRKAFKEKAGLKNEFNTGLGLSHSKLDKATYAQFAEGLAKQGAKAHANDSTAMLEFVWFNVSVESHVDEGYGSAIFFLWVLESKCSLSRPIRFDTQALFRYYNLSGKRQEVRLQEGQLIAFNQNRAHEMLFCGDEVRLALGVVRRSPKKNGSISDLDNVFSIQSQGRV